MAQYTVDFSIFWFFYLFTYLSTVRTACSSSSFSQKHLWIFNIAPVVHSWVINSFSVLVRKAELFLFYWIHADEIICFWCIFKWDLLNKKVYRWNINNTLSLWLVQRPSETLKIQQFFVFVAQAKGVILAVFTDNRPFRNQRVGFGVQIYYFAVHTSKRKGFGLIWHQSGWSSTSSSIKSVHERESVSDRRLSPALE